MLSATLVRSSSTDQGTFGVLGFGTEVCRSLELPWRENKRKISCIPTGVYQAVWLCSPTKGWCYHILDVPDRAGILIHAANLAGDVEFGFDTQLLGCIAPCTRIGFMVNSKGFAQSAGLVSKPALNLFHSWGNRQDIKLEIS